MDGADQACWVEGHALRRLEVLLRWMDAVDVNLDMRAMLEESIEELRDLTLEMLTSQSSAGPPLSGAGPECLHSVGTGNRDFTAHNQQATAMADNSPPPSRLAIATVPISKTKTQEEFPMRSGEAALPQLVEAKEPCWTDLVPLPDLDLTLVDDDLHESDLIEIHHKPGSDRSLEPLSNPVQLSYEAARFMLPMRYAGRNLQVQQIETLEAPYLVEHHVFELLAS